jgi:hypothetical protein
MVRECIALGALALKSTHGRRPGNSLFRREFIFRGAGLQLFERKRGAEALEIVCAESWEHR